ncbi:hypothetical protein MAR_009023 [Mya arenaria]|uniref:Uncharacterized protein n=1 Tax=Mya arenaria TaxID=6604 RepID=A0ABY7DXK0_MYAAR|nr:hypothetical protein MAR_009023 [Mya arenaria]
MHWCSGLHSKYCMFRYCFDMSVCRRFHIKHRQNKVP